MTGMFVPPGSNNEISGTGYQIALTEVDPTTGLPRLIVGNLTGIYSGLDNNGTFESSIGSSDATPSVNRNGNLQLAQFYYGAAQPSSAAAQAAEALFYGGAENIGGQVLGPQPADRRQSPAWTQPSGWTSPITPPGSRQTGGIFTNASGTAVDQQGNGTALPVLVPRPGRRLHQFRPGQRRRPDLRAAPGQQRRCPTARPAMDSPTSYANLVVNPVNSQDLLVSSTTGNIFETTNQGETWFDIGTPATFGSPGSHQLRPGLRRPRPSAPEGVGNLGNFLYVGTCAPAQDLRHPERRRQLAQHLPRPRRLPRPADHHRPRPGQPRRLRRHHHRRLLPRELHPPGPEPHHRPDEWVNITGGSRPWPIPSSARATTRRPTRTPRPTTWPRSSTRSRPTGTTPSPIIRSDLSQGYHPVLYVAANSGVYMSTDNGTTWTLFPATTYGAVAEGGDLPHVNVTDLSLSQGNVAVATGMPDLAGPVQPRHDSQRPTGRTPTSCLAAHLRRRAPSPSTWPRDPTCSSTYGSDAINLGILSRPSTRPTPRGPRADGNPRSSPPPRRPSTASARSPASATPPGSRSSTRPRATRPSGRSSAGSTRSTVTARPVDPGQLGQLDRLLRQLRHPDHDRLRVQRPEDDRGLHHRRRGGREQQGHALVHRSRPPTSSVPPPTRRPPAPTLALAPTAWPPSTGSR